MLQNVNYICEIYIQLLKVLDAFTKDVSLLDKPENSLGLNLIENALRSSYKNYIGNIVPSKVSDIRKEV